MRAAVRRAWVLDNIQKIGPGGFYHLAYAHNQIEPKFMERIRTINDYGKIQVFLLTDDKSALLMAKGEVFAIHWFPEFIRIHFMIETVHRIEAAPTQAWDTDFMIME